MAKIKIRRGTAAQLTGITLDLGELGWTTDTKKFHIGDGVSNILINEDQPEYITESITKTVGAGQDFTTLNDAFEWLYGIDALGLDSSDANPWYPNHGLNNITITLSLIAGTFDSTGSTGGGWRLRNKNYNLTIVGDTSATTTISSCKFTFEDMGYINIDNLTLSGCYYRSLRCSTFLGLSIEWTSIKSEDFVATGTEFRGDGSLYMQGTGIYTDCKLRTYDGAEILLYGSENASSRGAWSFNDIICGSDSYMYIDPYYSGHGDLTVGRVMTFGGNIDLGPDQSFGTTGKLVIEKVGSTNASYLLATGTGKISIWATEVEVKHAYNYTTYPGMTGAFVASDNSSIIFLDDKVTDITVTTLLDSSTPCFNAFRGGTIIYDESVVTFNAPSGIQNNTPPGQMQKDGSCIYDSVTVPTTEDVITEDITKTVGAGQDFTTLEDAFDYIMELNSKMAINDDTEDYGKNKPSVTLDLTAATHTVTGHNSSNFCTLRNIDFTVYIFGATSATSLIRGSGKYLTFIDCKGVFFDNLDIGVGLKVVGTRIGGGSTFDSTAFKSDDLIFTQYQQFEFGGGAEAYFTGDVLAVDKIWNYYCNVTFYPNSGSLTGDWNVTQIFSYGGVLDFEPWNNDLYISKIYSAQNSSVFVGVGNELFLESVNGFTTYIGLLAASGSTLEVSTWADDINFNGSGANDSCEAHTEGKLSLKANNGSNNIVFDGIGSGQYGFSSSEGGSINITANAITNNTIETINEHPYGQIQTDGAVIYDGIADSKSTLDIEEDITKTVGTGKDFATLPEAFRWVERLRPITLGEGGWGGQPNLPKVTLLLSEETHTLSPDKVGGYYTRCADSKVHLIVMGESFNSIVDTDTNETSLQFMRCERVQINGFHLIGSFDAQYCKQFITYGSWVVGQADLKVTGTPLTTYFGGGYCNSYSVSFTSDSVPVGKMYLYGCPYVYINCNGMTAPDFDIHPRNNSSVNVSCGYGSVSTTTIGEVAVTQGSYLEFYGDQDNDTFVIEFLQAYDAGHIGSRNDNLIFECNKFVASYGGKIELHGDLTASACDTLTCENSSTINFATAKTKDITMAVGKSIRCQNEGTIYFGGGTTLVGDSTARLFDCVRGSKIYLDNPTITEGGVTNYPIQYGVVDPDGSVIYDNIESELKIFDGFLAVPKGYTGGKGFEFRFDTSQTGYIYDAYSGLTFTVNDGTNPGTTAIANLFEYSNSYFNLNDYKDVTNNWELEVTGLNLTNSSNTSWMPYVAFHSGGVNVVTTIKVWFREGDNTTWTEVYNGDAKDFIVPSEYTVFTTGNLTGLRFRFEGITGNSYLKMIGATSRTSDSFAWQMLKSGGNFYGDIAGKSVGVENWSISQAGVADFVSITQDSNAVLDASDVDDTPVDAATAVPISSNWAYDHQLSSNPHNSATDLGFKLGDAAGSYAFSVRTNADDSVFDVYSDGQLTVTNTVSIDATLDFTFGSGGIYLDTGTPIEARASQDITMKLGDAAGANKLSVTDSADVEQFSVDSDGKTTINNDLIVNDTIWESPGVSKTDASLTLSGGDIYLSPASSSDAVYIIDQTSGYTFMHIVDDYWQFGSGEIAGQGWIDQLAGNITAYLADTAGAKEFRVADSNSSVVFTIDSDGVMKTDTINEFTAANGVDIDGLKIKDGEVVTGGTSYFDGGITSSTEIYLTSTDSSDISLQSDFNIYAVLGDALGAREFQIMDSGFNAVFSVDSDGNVTPSGSIYLDSARAIVEDDGSAGNASFSLVDGNVFHYLGDAAGSTYFGVVDSGINDVFTVDSDGNVDWDGTATGNGTVPTGGTSGQILAKNSATNYDLTWTDASSGTSVTIADTAPGTPSAGDLWFDSSAGIMSMYYNDGTSSQWVSISAGSWGFSQTNWGDIGGTLSTQTDLNTALGLKLSIADIDDTPVDGVTDAPISSNWAYDHSNSQATHFITLDNTDDLNSVSIPSFHKWTGDNVPANIPVSGKGGVVISVIEDSTPLPYHRQTVISEGNLYERLRVNYGAWSAWAVPYIREADVDDTPVDSATTAPISSNWAYDHENDPDAHLTEEYVAIACSDETTDLEVATAVATFRAPYAMTITKVRASVTTAPTGANLIVDINDGGTTIMTTNKLSIDATEKTSVTATTAPGITDTSIADDAEITIDIDQIGSTVAGAGLKVVIYFTRA